jgi:hypothetical protein
MKDEAYIKHRDSLIPQAMRHADTIAGPRPTDVKKRVHEQWSATWNRAYHGMMNILANAHLSKAVAE